MPKKRLDHHEVMNHTFETSRKLFNIKNGRRGPADIILDRGLSDQS